MAIGFTCFVLRLCLQIRKPVYQWLFCSALLAYPVIHVEDTLVRLKNRADAIPQEDLQALMHFVRGPNRTCTAFAPSHPVFCRDASGLSNGWDLFFAESIRDPQQLARFRRLWHEGIQQTTAQPPDLILRSSPENIWQRALHAGLITSEELHRLDALRSAYEVRQLGPREIWLRRDRR